MREDRNDTAITPAKNMAHSAAGWGNLTVSQRIERAAEEARANGTYGRPTPSAADEAAFKEKVAQSLGLGKGGKKIHRH